MGFLDTLGQMGVLFLMVIIGFTCHKLKMMNDTFDRSLSVLIINVTAPCIILSSVMGETLPGRDEILPVLILGTCTLVFMLITGIICAKLLRSSEEGIYRFMFAFGNINFIGLPVTSALFGTYAIFYISVLTIPFNFFIFLLGQLFISSCRKDKSGALSSPERNLYRNCAGVLSNSHPKDHRWGYPFSRLHDHSCILTRNWFYFS